MPDIENKEKEALLKTNEICELLKISESSLRNYLKNEHFPRLKIGGEYRFLYSEVLAFMRENANAK